ncbi:MAG: DUF5723 family protein [Bacteroidales bacterium]|nr:DUF5723 family protein [Bacteroidales bacterium]
MKTLKFVGRIVLPIVLFVSFWVNSDAQYLRTSYFMDASPFRMQLNPALTPMRGYVNIPVLGSINASANSPICMSDIIDILDGFDASRLYSDKFLGSLNNINKLNASVATDIVSAGWYDGGGDFWSFNVGLHADVNAVIPRSTFTFIRDVTGGDFQDTDWHNWKATTRGERLEINSYFDVGVGLARAITDRLTVGARLKVLLGIGNANINVSNISAETNLDGVPDGVDWSKITQAQIEEINGTAGIDSKASMVSSFKGLEFTKNNNGTIDDMKFNARNLGLAGYGLGLDLGVAYKLMDHLTVSAAVIDLGFITWLGNATEYASSDSNLSFDSSNPGDIERFADLVGSADVLNLDLMNLEVYESKKNRTTMLSATIVAGAEYSFLQDKLSAGLLYTGRITSTKMLNELTLSFNVVPSNWFNVAVSYSVIQSLGQSFGLAVKLGPLFVGSDYMFLGSRNTMNLNAYLGICIPIGRRRS